MYHSGKLYFTLHRDQIQVVRKVNDRVVLLMQKKSENGLSQCENSKKG